MSRAALRLSNPAFVGQKRPSVEKVRPRARAAVSLYQKERQYPKEEQYPNPEIPTTTKSFEKPRYPTNPVEKPTVSDCQL